MSDVRIESHDTVREIVLTAPHRRNALNRRMLAEFADAVATIAADDRARAVIIRGEGKSFCAGADLTSLFGDPNREVSVLRAELSRVYASFLSLTDLTVPIISAVQGAAVGAGANIAFASDLVVCGPRARFGLTFADIGLHPGGGSSWFLTRALGPQRAKAILLGAEIIDAERARELAARYATRDPELNRSILSCIDMAVDADLAAVTEVESWAQASTVTKPAFQEFLDSFAPKKAGPDHGDAASGPGQAAYVGKKR